MTKNTKILLAAGLLVLGICVCSAILVTGAIILATSRAPLFAQKEIMPADVIATFQTAGLEAENPTIMTYEDYKNSLFPMADESIHFYVPSIDPTAGGRVFYYTDLNQLAKTQNYYVSLGNEMAAFRSWVFVRDHILVQINGSLPEEQARKYETALQSIQP